MAEDRADDVGSVAVFVVGSVDVGDVLDNFAAVQVGGAGLVLGDGAVGIPEVLVVDIEAGIGDLNDLTGSGYTVRPEGG